MNNTTEDTFDLRPLLRGSGQTVGVFLALICLIVFGLMRYKNFGGAYNIASFLNYNAMFILISIGMCLVIITGGIDLSVGSVAAFSSVCAAYLSPYGLQVALPGGVLAGTAFGALNAFIILALTVPPFIALCRAIEPYDLQWFEEPIEPDDYGGYAQIVDETGMPLAMACRSCTSVWCRGRRMPVLSKCLSAGLSVPSCPTKVGRASSIMRSADDEHRDIGMLCKVAGV